MHAECNSKVSVSSIDTASSFSVSVLDVCIRNLKLGKACDPDDLVTRYLLHAHLSHLSLIVHLKFLFSAISLYC